MSPPRTPSAPRRASAMRHCGPRLLNRPQCRRYCNRILSRAQYRRRGTSLRRLRPGQRRPTRITVDLVADLHGFLRGYAQARDVAAADVIRELIRQVRADPDLSARVTAELARRQEALAEAMRAARE